MTTIEPGQPGGRSPVLVVGGTGHLGAKVVDQLLARGRRVRALVRPGSDASGLRSRNDVEIASGDMLDLESLVRAMTGVDAVVTTAAGYTRRDRRAEEIDTTGNANLAEAAARTGVRRFVLTSILTCDQTPQVPHFWNKKRAEDRLDDLGVPFVALRPGAFLDQVTTMAGDPFRTGRFSWIGSATVPLTFVLTDDLAACLAAAVDADVAPGERIDIGWDRPVSMQEVADLAGRLTGGRFRVQALPAFVLKLLGLVMPPMRDMSSMVEWFATGGYVADTTRQGQIFGPVPTAEDAVARFARSSGREVAPRREARPEDSAPEPDTAP